MDKITPELRKAVKEYYTWHGEKNAKAVRYVQDYDEFTYLLVRFKNEGNEELSSLALVSNWADGHCDVEEIFDCDREHEDDMLECLSRYGIFSGDPYAMEDYWGVAL